MSYKVTQWVLARSQARCGARLVLLALAELATDAGVVPFPKQARLAELARKTMLDERSVRRAIAKLEKLGELEVARAPGQLSEYRVLMGAARAAARPGRAGRPAAPASTATPAAGAGPAAGVVYHFPAEVVTPPPMPDPSAPAMAVASGAGGTPDILSPRTEWPGAGRQSVRGTPDTLPGALKGVVPLATRMASTTTHGERPAREAPPGGGGSHREEKDKHPVLPLQAAVGDAGQAAEREQRLAELLADDGHEPAVVDQALRALRLREVVGRVTSPGAYVLATAERLTAERQRAAARARARASPPAATGRLSESPQIRAWNERLFAIDPDGYWLEGFGWQFSESYSPVRSGIPADQVEAWLAEHERPAGAEPAPEPVPEPAPEPAPTEAEVAAAVEAFAASPLASGLHDAGIPGVSGPPGVPAGRPPPGEPGPGERWRRSPTPAAAAALPTSAHTTGGPA